MESISSKAKTAAVVVAVFAAASASVFLLRPAAEVEAPATEPATEPPQVVELSQAEREQTALAAKPARVPAAAPPVHVLESKAKLSGSPSFDAPECPDLAFVSPSPSADDTVATVRHGDSPPEQVRVGDLLESGEVIFIGKHPTSGTSTVVLKDEAGKQCQIGAPRPVVAVERADTTAALQWRGARTAPLGAAPPTAADARRVESLAIKVPPGAWHESMKAAIRR